MKESLLEKIKSWAAALAPEVISIRHHLHAHPELSFQEQETAAFIAARLTQWGIPHQSGVGGFGITGLVQPDDQPVAASRRCIALRADMDALPIQEKNEVPYRSVYEGKMHACGHDVHSSALLGALKILWELRNELQGTIKFIFQPAEEKFPGGASLMIAEGVLENPKPDAIIGQHVFTPLEVGTCGFRPGRYMASADEIYIRVKGKGGHAAEPDQVVNPIFLAAHLLISLEQLIRELAQAEIPTVLAFGKMEAAGASNVIPSEVTIDGTLRTMDEPWRLQVHERIAGHIQVFSAAHGHCAEMKLAVGYPCLVNDERVTEAIQLLAGQYLGADRVKPLQIRMASEDFAFYSHRIPACFYRIGTGNPSKNITSGVHTSTFDIDEEALEIASGMMAWIGMELLKR